MYSLNNRINIMPSILIYLILGVIISYHLTRNRSIILFILVGIGFIAIFLLIENLPTIIRSIRIKNEIIILFLLIIISTLSFNPTNAETSIANPFRLANIFRISIVFYVGFTTISKIVLSKINIIPFVSKKPLNWGFCYFLIGIPSLFFSVSYLYTGYKLVEVFIDVLFIVYLYFNLNFISTEKEDDSLINLIFLSFSLLLISIWLWGILDASHFFLKRGIEGIFPLMNGRIIPANSLSECGAILLVISLSRLLLKKRDVLKDVMVAGVLLGGVTLIISQSRTSLFAVLIFIFILIRLSKFAKLATSLISVGFFLYFGNKIFETITEYVYRGQNLQQFLSLSGRVPVWIAAFEKACESPFFGFGFGSGSRILEILGWEGLHNSFFEALLNTGFIGLLFFALSTVGVLHFIFISINKLKKMNINQSNLLSMVGISIIFLLRAFTSSAISGWHTYPLIFYYLLLGYITSINNRKLDYN